MIYTHGGIFHADDAMACAIARLAGYGPEITRVVKLPENFKDGDIAVDIGGAHEPANMVFDHHYPGGNDDGRAACGKLWAFMGKYLCQSSIVADRVYLTLLGSIDRSDIGVPDWNQINGDMRHVSANMLIYSMNPPSCSTRQEVDAAFEIAVQACKIALEGSIANARMFCRMQDIVSFASRPEPEVLVFSQDGPWQEHVLADSRYENVLYVIFPSQREGFQIQCVPPSAGSFGKRKPLPEGWSGLSGRKLAEAANMDLIDGPGLFCHPNRFIGGAMNLTDALKLARLAIAA